MPHSLSWFAVALTTVCLACTSAEPPSSESPPTPAAPRTAASWLAAPAWSPAPPMRRTRSLHTTTMLASGKLLVAGGRDEFGSTLGADVYDPATGTWSATGPMRQQRLSHTATLLPSGKVLVAGGGSSPASAELYDPATNTWSATGSLVQRRGQHTATLLPSGKVLVAGGIDIDLLGYLTSCELYDPVTGTWSTTGSLPVARYWHSTTLLSSGKVLVAGGTSSSGAALNRVDLYDPATGTWSQTGSMVTPRFDHITVLLHSGQVLAAGGHNLSPSANIASAELYNPATGTWSTTGSMAEARYLFQVTLLTSGQVLVTGGNQTTTLGTAELFNPATGTWSAAPTMPTPRYWHTSTLLPDGRVFLAGGRNDPFNLASVDVYDPAAGAWSTAGFMSKARFRHTGTLLPSGKVLVVGGNDGTSPSQASADLYDPVNNIWASTGSLSQPRSFHTATLLQSGKVLVAGGLYPSGPQPNAELYDPATGSWSAASALAEPRSSGHTSTLLPSGKVLVTGGWRSTTLGHVELYDPATNSWSSAPSVSHARGYHTATVLPSGKVLVTGGEDDTGPLSSAELYDPFTRTWSTTGAMAQARARHTATLLPSGKVLVTGGHQASSLALASAELYDPATGTWSTTGSMAALRREHAAVLMPSGKVLVVSGGNTSGRVTSTEEYDPATGTWKIVGTMATGRVSPTATLLPTGKVLITGGQGDFGPRDTTEVYDPLVATPAWKPAITGLTPGSPWAPGNAVTVTGARFRGLSESGSGAPRASNTDAPLLSLLDVQQERLITFPFQNFSATQVTATVPAVPSGHYLLTLTANALSAHQVVQVSAPAFPDTALTSTPPPLSDQPSATFSFVTEDPGDTFECSLDGAAFSSCASPISYTPLAEGSHSFQVRARNALGNVDPSPANFSWVIDLTDPDTLLTSTPPNPTNQATAAFSFTATEAGATFECKLDAAAFTACTSPASYTNLVVGAHTFQVRARDTAGHVDATPASYSWTLDVTAPDTLLTSTPSDPTNQSSATFSFSATEAGATFECKMDGTAFTACSSPASYASLTEGAHTFQVRARDAAGNVDATPASFSWALDLTAPNTTLTSTPPNPSNQTTATFSFTSTEAGATFECKLDSAAFTACTSPASYTNLSMDAHTFQVRARDAAGNVDASPASYLWGIDFIAPNTSINSTPPNPSNQATATFRFSTTETGAITFECKLDAAAFTACTSPISYTNLVAGAHTFQVRSRDAAGNVDASPASFTWTVDLSAPDTSLTLTPPSRTNQTTATFSFTATEAGATFACKLDSADFTFCTSPASYTHLTEGAHSFQVRALDTAGNVDTSPATYSWTVDLTPPDTALTGGPLTPSNQPTATFVLYSTESGSTFECKMDEAAFSACTSPASYGSLAHGTHTFQVRARDAAGNVDASPATHSWTVDLTVPDTVLTSTPPNPSNQFTSTFTFTSPEPGATFECKLGNSSYTACTSPATYSVGVGTATFQVRARDAAGNIDATPASYTWTIDVTAPESTLTSTPTDPTRQTTATFTFTATEAGSTFECRLDGAAFSACTSPISYSDLAGGSHSFRVRARDIAGNVETSPASHFWFIDLVPPNTSLSSTPYNPTNEPTATFVIGATETGGIYECSLDGAPFSVCTSPITYPNLADGVHTFQARAYDAVGNMDPTPASYTWTLDATVPDTFISSPPSSPSNQNSVSIPFSSPEAGVSFECKLDGWSFTLCASPSRHTNLAEGSHTFQVRARDAAGNIDPTPASTTWVVDLTAPDTLLDSAPPNASSENTATFTFSSEAGATFECRLDGEAFSSCASPVSVTNLAEGSHTFQVRAWDAAGNVDATPASSSWTVDLTVPDTLLTAYPPDPTNQLSATFGFSSTEAGALFECKLDAGAFTSCTSPASYASLAPGVHTFQVRARDAAGNVDPTPSLYNWTIDVLEPNTTITLNPADPTRQTSAIFSFTSTEARSTFECSLDAEDFNPCSSPISYANMAEGTHTFLVRARDVAGNVDSSPASYTWLIDLTPPNTSIGSAPSNPSNQSSATFAFSSEAGTTFECSRDAEPFSACTSPTRYDNLAEGPHAFQVRARDTAGNVDPSPASFSWLIDLTAPDTLLTSIPPNPSNQSSATFAFSGTDPGATLECSLDGAAFSLCISPRSYSNLSEGSHTFQVRARDAVGNVDPSPASYSWIIDVTVPDTALTSTPPNPSNQPTATFTFSATEVGATFECSLDGGLFSACSSPIRYDNLAEGSHSFYVRARDAAGNVDPTAAFYSWSLDRMEPDTLLLSTPANLSNQPTATFTFSATETGATFECSLDAGPFNACASPIRYDNLAEGRHSFSVRAQDSAGNVDASPVAYSWTVDLTAPDTLLTSIPPSPTNQPTATFTFSAMEEGATFECSLDAGLFSACSSPFSYNNLSAGSHLFQVRARDTAGNVDPSPASASWTLEITAPDTLLTSTPINPTAQSSASFTFSATEEGVTFECSLDGADFSSCASPVSLANLFEGLHTFQVRARDAAGNVDPSPASFSWVIDLSAPDTLLTSTPSNPSNQPTASFTFSGTEAEAAFECSLDGAGFSVCTSPASLASLSEGAHTFRVRTRDTAGNLDSTPASFSWVIDLAVPSAPVITSPADGALISEPQPVISGTAQPGSFITLTLDETVLGLTTADEAGTWAFTLEHPLADGEHLVTATSSDTGGTSSASTPVRFTVDTTPDTPEPPDPGGCDCAAGSGDASWLLGGLALLARLTSRRRRPQLR